MFQVEGTARKRDRNELASFFVQGREKRPVGLQIREQGSGI